MVLRIALLTGEELRVPQTVSNLRNPQIGEVIRLLNTSLFFPRGEKCYRVLDAETGMELTTPEQWEEVKLAARRATMTTAATNDTPPASTPPTTSSIFPSSASYAPFTASAPGVVISPRHQQQHHRQLAPPPLPPPQLVALTIQLGGASTAASQITVGERKWVQAVSRRRQSISPSNRNSTGGGSSGNGRCISPTQLQDNTHSERLCEYATSVLRLAAPSPGSQNNSMFGNAQGTSGVFLASPTDQQKQLLVRSGRPTSPSSNGLTNSPTSKQQKQYQSSHWLHQHHHHHHHHVLHHHHHHHFHLQQQQQQQQHIQVQFLHQVGPALSPPQLDISPPASTSTTKSKRLIHDEEDEEVSCAPPSSNIDTQPPMAALTSSTFRALAPTERRESPAKPSATRRGESPPKNTRINSTEGAANHEPAHFHNNNNTNIDASQPPHDCNNSPRTTDTLIYKTQSFQKPTGLPQPVQYLHHHHHHHLHHHMQHHNMQPKQQPVMFNGSGVFSHYPSSPVVVTTSAPPSASPPMHRSAVSLVNAIARDKGAALIDRIADVIEEREFLAEEEKRVGLGGGGMSWLVGAENSNMIHAPGAASTGRRKSTTSGSAGGGGGAIDSAMIAPLVEMGFSPAVSRYALRRCGGGGGRNVEQAIELLLQLTSVEIERIEAKEKLLMEKEKLQQPQPQISLEEEQQQQQLLQQLKLVHPNTPRLSLKQLLTHEELQRRQQVSKLIDMGFTGQSSRDALRRADGDFDTACIFLLEDASNPNANGTNISSSSHRRSSSHHDRGNSNDHYSGDAAHEAAALHQQSSGSTIASSLPSSANAHATWFDPIETFVRRNDIAAENALSVIRAINESPQNVFLVWHCFTLGFTVSKMASVFNGGAPTTTTAPSVASGGSTMHSVYSTSSTAGPMSAPSVTSAC